MQTDTTDRGAQSGLTACPTHCTICRGIIAGFHPSMSVFLTRWCIRTGEAGKRNATGIMEGTAAETGESIEAGTGAKTMAKDTVRVTVTDTGVDKYHPVQPSIV